MSNFDEDFTNEPVQLTPPEGNEILFCLGVTQLLWSDYVNRMEDTLVPFIVGYQILVNIYL